MAMHLSPIKHISPFIAKKTFTELDYEYHTMSAISVAGTTYPSGAPGFATAFLCSVL